MGCCRRSSCRRWSGETNRALAENLPVQVFFPDKEEEKRLDYRSKKKEVEGALRLVEIPGYDLCACCAPHVKRTGEIRMLKVMQFQHYKGGVGFLSSAVSGPRGFPGEGGGGF